MRWFLRAWLFQLAIADCCSSGVMSPASKTPKGTLESVKRAPMKASIMFSITAAGKSWAIRLEG